MSGSLASLPVSRDYDAFVRRPTGIVEQYTGHPVYRTDLSAAIESGDSWQLGLFLAHLLKREDKLAEGDEPAALQVLVTGRLNRDLDVGPVDFVAEKLARAGPTDDGGGLFLFPLEGEHPPENTGWDCRPVADAKDALRACLGEARANRLLEPAATALRAAPWPGRLWFAAGLGLACLLGGAFAVRQLPGTGDAARAPAPAGQSIMAVEIIPRDHEGCGAPLPIGPDVDRFDGMACAAIVSVRRDGEFWIMMSVSGAFLEYVDAQRYRLEHHGYASGGDWLVRRIDFPYWVRRPMTLEAEVTQLSLDGARILTARRSIEVHPGRVAE
ncbi:hypothetical protein NUH88_05980 [Nisaea acidiphila]|uniref:Uncharacterized protein n=1 Tax=Nisaea acidiphila TaxID=1862145 RepID=A0A9J7AVT7_9PROT|nr:hypothetical protein [Nisaea acidiphila]UUX51238.1 hypothetical protein NUH88_05980 [Nisaea acidiphila]